MSTFDIKSVALKWYFFTSACFTVYDEFAHVYMKQLGFSPQQIGLSSLFGVQHLFIPLLPLLGDKFRARKLILWIVTIFAMVTLILPLLPLVVSLPTCFTYTALGPTSLSNRSTEMIATPRNVSAHSECLNVTKPSPRSQNVPFMSNLFFLMTVSRSLVNYLDAVVLSLASLATISYLAKERINYGAYYMWMHVGTSVSIASSAAIAWVIRISICGNEGYGYFASFIVATIICVFSMLSLPWIEFKYETDRTINWIDVESVVFNCHYVYMYFMNFLLGTCLSFRIFWEFWYLDGLEAGPLVMGGTALIRRPILAMSLFGSSYVIKRIGDLYTVCISFILFALAFFCLSFSRVYWYVLAIDMFQATGSGLAMSAFTVHFSKAGTKASSGVILGLQQMCLTVGHDGGASLLGVLFQKFGTRTTLLSYALTTAILVGILLLYVKCSKQANEYEKLPEDSDDDGCYEENG